jgi:ABC-2 type transport system permease protein
MKFREIFRFELAYQARGVSTWIVFPVLVGVAFLMMSESFFDARRGEYFLNAPWMVAGVTVFLPGSLLWLLGTAAVSGDVATRDVRTRMHPLTHTARVSKADYLGGRFLTAFVLNALILLALPAGSLFAVLLAGADAGTPGPFRPTAYLGAYVFLALPNAFIATAIQFSLAALSRRANAGYLGGVLIFAVMAFGAVLAEDLGLWELAKLVDPIGIVFMGEVSRVWTPTEMNTLLIALESSLLANRLIWLGVALGALAFTYRRFQFAHYAAGTQWSRLSRRRHAHAPPPAGIAIPALSERSESKPISSPQVQRKFNFATHVHQTFAIAGASFGMMAKSWSGVVLALAVATFAGLLMLDQMQLLGIPLLPRTADVLTGLTNPVAGPGPWLTIPLLTVFWGGELIWREREAGVSAMVDAAPLPEWVLFLGKFLGLGLVLAACTALLMAVGMLDQMRRG